MDCVWVIAFDHQMVCLEEEHGQLNGGEQRLLLAQQ
jgi:hypothetical protein